MIIAESLQCDRHRMGQNAPAKWCPKIRLCVFLESTYLVLLSCFISTTVWFQPWARRKYKIDASLSLNSINYIIIFLLWSSTAIPYTFPKQEFRPSPAKQKQHPRPLRAIRHQCALCCIFLYCNLKHRDFNSSAEQSSLNGAILSVWIT